MDKIFWPLLGLGVIFLILVSPVYVQIALGITFVLFAMVWIRLDEIVANREAFKSKLTDYLSKLENTIHNVRGDQNYVTEQKENSDMVTKNEMKESLDGLAVKMIGFENKLNQMRKTLAAAFSALDERIKSLEEETYPQEEE